MRPIIIGLATSLLIAGAAVAQTTNTTTNNSTDPTGATSPATSGTPAATSNPAAAAGDNNQAVATTNANAATPAKGHNSFTRGQARHRIQAEGFTAVTGLHKDNSGVWRGTATKDGKSTGVWLDYKGNVGASAT